MAAKPTAPTPAHAWRKQREEGELIRLPGSGNVARLIRPALSMMALSSNGIPNPLSRNVQKLLAGTAPPKDEAERWANYQTNMRGYHEVAALCLAEPRLRLDGPPQEGEIGPEDLTSYDYIWIYYTWGEGVAEQVAPFLVAPEPGTA
jgi:hypothetical protein